MSFTADISKWVAKANGNTDKVVRKVIIDLGSGIITKNPVGDPTKWEGFMEARASANIYHWLEKADFYVEGYVGGRSRANWQYGNNIMPSGIIDSVDPTGGQTIAKITAGVSTSPTASVHWLANSLPYIKRLEDGYSKQAPAGMLKLTVEEFKQTVERAARSVR